MTTTDLVAPGTQRSTIIIKRVFDLPPDIVWKAWTEPASLKKWWGPQEYTCPFFEVDLKPGGKYLGCMKDATGREIWGTGTYQEIIPQSKIVYTDSFADSNGNIVKSTYYGMPEMPVELMVVVQFEDVAGKTNMTLKHAGLPADMATDCIKGWESSFDKLETNLKR